MNIICVICSDLLVPSDDVYYTPCGHVFHYTCLLQWIERSRTCPQCRERTTESKIHRIYFNFSNNDTIIEDPISLQSKIDNLTFQIKLRDKNITDLVEKNKKLEKQTSDLRHEVRKVEGKVLSKDSAIFALNEQVKFFKQEYSDVKNYKEVNKQLKQELEHLKSVRSLIDESVSKMDSIIMATNDVSKLKTYIAVLKREMIITSDKGKEIRDKYNNLRHQYARVFEENKILTEERIKRRNLEEQLMICESKKISLEAELFKLRGDTLKHDSHNSSMEHSESSKEQEKHNAIKKSNTVNNCMIELDNTYLLSKTLQNDDSCIVIDDDAKNSLQNIKSQGFFSIENDRKRQASSSNIKVPEILKKKSRFGSHNQRSVASRGMTYDGFGGHAKFDNFPKPISNLSLKKSK